MCGICGIIRLKNRTVDRQALFPMMEVLTHRGPDSEGTFACENAGLGFRRLKIIDPKGADQPLASEDGQLVLICNGEIYNYQNLREQLLDRGHRFKTEGDAEVILHLYEDEGPSCLEKLRGMFAFAIWNKKDDRLFLARDRFGIKPLYYSVSRGFFFFASEIKALLADSRVQRKVNLQSFLHYLSFQYVADPDTMFAGIHKLPPGHYLTLTSPNEQNPDPEPYWEPEFNPDRSRPLSHFVERVKEELQESVEYHTQSDYPVGAFLSSGIDSSSIAALLAKRGELKTFSVGFAHPGYSELDDAEETARHLGTSHHTVLITPERYCDVLPRLVWHQDEPVADPSAIALYFVNEIARNYVRVVLSGEGADELFGGYRIYRETADLEHFRRLPKPVKRGLRALASSLPEFKGLNYIMRASTPVERRHRGIAHIFSEDEKPEIVNRSEISLDNFRDEDHFLHRFYDQVSGQDELTKMQFYDIKAWLPGDILMKADKMSMANSLELRVPFLDPKVFELAAKIPPEYKIRRGTTKYVLRKAVEDILPEKNTKRRKKAFPVPTSQWLRGGMKDFLGQIIESRGTDHLLNRKQMLRLYREHTSGRADHGRKLWTLMIFKLWHAIFIEQSIKP